MIKKRSKLLAIMLVFAFALTGIAYAAWTDSLEIQGTVNTGDIDVQFAEAWTNDQGIDPNFITETEVELAEFTALVQGGKHGNNPPGPPPGNNPLHGKPGHQCTPDCHNNPKHICQHGCDKHACNKNCHYNNKHKCNHSCPQHVCNPECPEWQPEPDTPVLADDIAETLVEIVDREGNGFESHSIINSLLRVTVNNAYPGYQSQVTYRLVNEGSVPVKITGVAINNNNEFIIIDHPSLDDLDDIILYPKTEGSDNGYEITFTQTVDQTLGNSGMNQQYTYDIQLDFTQWNL